MDEMPIMDVCSRECEEPDYQDLKWRIEATRTVFAQCINGFQSAQHRLESAKYCNVPMGIDRGGSDWFQMAADVLFARSLRAADHILWSVDSPASELAGQLARTALLLLVYSLPLTRCVASSRSHRC